MDNSGDLHTNLWLLLNCLHSWNESFAEQSITARWGKEFDSNSVSLLILKFLEGFRPLIRWFGFLSWVTIESSYLFLVNLWVFLGGCICNVVCFFFKFLFLFCFLTRMATHKELVALVFVSWWCSWDHYCFIGGFSL